MNYAWLLFGDAPLISEISGVWSLSIEAVGLLQVPEMSLNGVHMDAIIECVYVQNFELMSVIILTFHKTD